jgi:hypothetical protein
VRTKILTALCALPLATTANAGNFYSACFYNNDQMGYSMTPLFTLKGDALPAYGQWTYEKTLEWEAKVPGDMRGVSDYTRDDFVGQFVTYADDHKKSGGSSQALCLITTEKGRAQAWYRKKLADGRFEESLLKDWRPTKQSFLSVESWSGVALPGASAPAEPLAESEQQQSGSEAKDAAPVAPSRPKKSNAQADAEFAAAKAEYARKLAENAAEYKAAQDAVEQKKAEQRAAAKRVLAEYQQQLEAHEQLVRSQQRQAEAEQLEYRKLAAKPAGVPNAVYRGFAAADCDAARFAATNGAGTSSGTKFTEVTASSVPGTCTVQGWWWDTSRTGASRQ